MTADLRRNIRREDTELTGVEFSMCYRYYKKFFNRSPELRHKELFLLMIQIYRFEFDRWAEGKITYSAFTNNNKAKHLEWLRKQLNQKGIEIEGSLIDYVNS